MQSGTAGGETNDVDVSTMFAATSRAKVSEGCRSVRKIRFTAAEWQLIGERARVCGRPPARYVREVALGAVPKVSRPRANAPIIRDLGSIALELQVAYDRDSCDGHDTESELRVRLSVLADRVLGIVQRLA